MEAKNQFRMWTRLTAATTISLVLLCWFPVLGFCEDKYGAIAYSSRNGAWGWSNNYDTQEEAESRALAECRKQGSGCEVVQWFRNACGALASASNKAHGHSWDPSREEAARQALEWCGKYGGRDCALRCSPCTGD